MDESAERIREKVFFLNMIFLLSISVHRLKQPLPEKNKHWLPSEDYYFLNLLSVLPFSPFAACSTTHEYHPVININSTGIMNTWPRMFICCYCYTSSFPSCADWKWPTSLCCPSALLSPKKSSARIGCDFVSWGSASYSLSQHLGYGLSLEHFHSQGKCIFTLMEIVS